ncbi:MAG: hypothetical protein BWY99_01655 [Synergistetes bacterium ADurb.BinA166]|nr:MAG: hypothetical protein BWY99_01655 [Synergistetes bacterium ADurb.BinA166]
MGVDITLYLVRDDSDKLRRVRGRSMELPRSRTLAGHLEGKGEEIPGLFYAPLPGSRRGKWSDVDSYGSRLRIVSVEYLQSLDWTLYLKDYDPELKDQIIEEFARWGDGKVVLYWS